MSRVFGRAYRSTPYAKSPVFAHFARKFRCLAGIGGNIAYCRGVVRAGGMRGFSGVSRPFRALDFASRMAAGRAFQTSRVASQTDPGHISNRPGSLLDASRVGFACDPGRQFKRPRTHSLRHSAPVPKIHCMAVCLAQSPQSSQSLFFEEGKWQKWHKWHHCHENLKTLRRSRTLREAKSVAWEGVRAFFA